MDCRKIGELIQSLRKEHKLTQQALAEKINVGDKAVSKWERGHGCPDVSVMPALARVFNISVESLLSGDLSVDESKGDTVKNANFYVCSQCGNIASSTTDMELLCCGKRLSSLKSEKPDNEHQLEVQLVEGEYHLQSEHPMLKEHHFSFIALVSPDLLLVKRLYPEWNLDVRLPQLPWATLYWYCGEHGLFSQKLNIK